MKNKFEILVYHRIGKSSSLDGLTVGREIFKQQMELLHSKRRPMALSDLVNRIFNRKPIPNGAVAVTFDDGYRDTFKTALPILKRFKIPATVFITTGFIDRAVRGYRNAPMMSWGMVRKLHKAGIEIGAHTMTHPNLKQCRLAKIQNEMRGSRKRLERELKAQVRLFAYPYGGPKAISLKIQKCAREAGFAAACTTLPGMNGAGTDLYALRRSAPIPDEIRDFVVCLNQAASRKSTEESKIENVSKKALQIWSRRYKKMRQSV